MSKVIKQIAFIHKSQTEERRQMQQALFAFNFVLVNLLELKNRMILSN